MSEEVMDNVNELDHVVADEPEPIEEPIVEFAPFSDEPGIYRTELSAEEVANLDSKVEQNRTESETGVDDMDVEGKIVYLDVGEIILPEASNVRMWSDKNPTAAETARIAVLAKTIKDKGQVQPIRVMERQLDGGGIQYELITGRRRVQAIATLDVPMKVRAEVVHERDAETVRQEAIIENVQREDINPIDFMYLIKDTRERLKLKGAKNTPKLAEYFGVSPAKIHTYEQLEGLDDETKAKVHEGEVSREGAFLLVGRVNAPEIVEKARVIQATELRGRPGKAKVVVDSKGEGKVKPVAVKARAIKKAIREVDSSTPIARGIKDVMDLFEGFDVPVYGYEDGAPRMFIAALRKFRAGEVGDKAVEKRWAECVTRAFKGTAPKSESRKADSEVKVKSKARQKK